MTFRQLREPRRRSWFYNIFWGITINKLIIARQLLKKLMYKTQILYWATGNNGRKSCKILQIAIIGDSHVRRLAEANQQTGYLQKKMFTPTFIFKGGAWTNWLWTVQLNEQFDYIVLAIGSNELQSCSIENLLGKLDSYAHFLVANGYCKKAFVMGLWPRPNVGFCNKAWRFNERGMTRHWHQDVMFWKWSKKLRFCFEDQAHLKKQCYVRALKYLISPVIFCRK